MRGIRYTHVCHSRVVRRGGVGDYSGGDTPVPIPNTVVKPSSPNDTAGAALWDNRTLPVPPRTTHSTRPGASRFGPFAGLRVSGGWHRGRRLTPPHRSTVSDENTPITPSPDEPLGNIANISNVSAPPSNAIPDTRRGSAWRVLRNRDYSLLFWGQLISAAGTQIQVVAVAWQVYEITKSPIALGVIGLVQAIPRLIFSLVGGVVADAYDRRRLLLIVNTVMASLSAILAISTRMGVINIGVIYLIVLTRRHRLILRVPDAPGDHPDTGAARTDGRRALDQHGADAAHIRRRLGGWRLRHRLGWSGQHLLDRCDLVLCRHRLAVHHDGAARPAGEARAGWSGRPVDGMRFLRAHPIILAVLSLDFFATFFGSPRALLPVYAVSILHVGAAGLGVLQAATSVGAVALAPLTGRIGRIQQQGLGVAVAIIGWGVCIICIRFLHRATAALGALPRGRGGG